MAEPLKNQYGADIPVQIADMFGAVYPKFDKEGFVTSSLIGYDKASLTERGWKMADAMRAHLPQDYKKAVEIMLASLGKKLERTENLGMSVFLYLPHVFFVSKYGLDDFELSILAQYELTQRFSAEFSIRPFLMQHTQKTLDVLEQWATDDNPHVRRLVSEGTRPRLPWTPRLPMFQKDPTPVLRLLELLKDDKELYVRRSVANNLNDIGKDNPNVLSEVAKKWLENPTKEREWLVRHALRSAIKRGDAGALEASGANQNVEVELSSVCISPSTVSIGESVNISFELKNLSAKSEHLEMDCKIHFIKANGKTSPKVFKLKRAKMVSMQSITVTKNISLAEMTTRKHYAGRHEVDVVVNGVVQKLGWFDLE